MFFKFVLFLTTLTALVGCGEMEYPTYTYDRALFRECMTLAKEVREIYSRDYRDLSTDTRKGVDTSTDDILEECKSQATYGSDVTVIDSAVKPATVVVKEQANVK